MTLAEFKNVVFMALIKTRVPARFLSSVVAQALARSGMSPGDAALDLLRRAAHQ
ncbi:hypothetical protein LNQ52_22800 [Klebsiella pneumoniae subsp. pneumoniae]|nr:hypothetical protein [Klebsiella pneumoniae subsp. pneumoniae]